MTVGAPAGFNKEAMGTSSAATVASHQTKCRDAAECFCSKNDIRAASVNTIVTPTACSMTKLRCHHRPSFFALLISPERRSSSPLRELAGGTVQERRHDLFSRPFEECLDQPAQGGLSRLLPRNNRQKYVPQSLLLMSKIALFFEHAELGTDGGVVRFFGKGLLDVSGCRLAELIDHVHDLPLTATEFAVWLFFLRLRASFIASC